MELNRINCRTEIGNLATNMACDASVGTTTAQTEIQVKVKHCNACNSLGRFVGLGNRSTCTVRKENVRYARESGDRFQEMVDTAERLGISYGQASMLLMENELAKIGKALGREPREGLRNAAKMEKVLYPTKQAEPHGIGG